MKMFILAIALFVIGCEVQIVPDSKQITTLNQKFKPLTNNTWYKPNKLTPWQVQIFGNIDINYNAPMYVLDLTNTRAEFIKHMKEVNKQIVCYFSAGVVGVNDKNSENFSKFIMGNNIDNLPIVWMNISSDSIIPIIEAKLNLAVQKGCDAILPSDLDEYTSDNGFGITKQEQIQYAKYIANSAHNKNLGVGLLGFDDVVPLYKELEPFFDFAIGSECHKSNNCDALSIFSDKNKAVFDVEFDLSYVRDINIRHDMCVYMTRKSINTIVVPFNLDNEFRYSCMD